jgi:hypothetical protein
MNGDFEKQLEAEIARELKALPPLRAPASLAPRVMRVIAQRAALPWYKQSWQHWPLPLRALSAVALLALFAGICFAAWKLSHTETFALALQKAGSLVASIGAIFKAVGVLVSSLGIVIKHLGTGFIVGCIVAGLLGYAVCLGLGTLYVRVGWRSAQGTNL